MFEGLLQPTHLVLILAIVLIIFGAGKLPEVFGSMGRGVKEFREASEGSRSAQPVPVATQPAEAAQSNHTETVTTSSTTAHTI